MSDPKPLRFARVDQEEGTPEWVEAGQKSGQAIRPLELPTVAFDAIDRAGDNGGVPDPDEAFENMEFGAEAANINSGQRASDASAAPPPPPPPAPPEPVVDPELERRLEEAVQAFSAAAADLAVAKKEALAQVEEDLLALSVHIAQAIIEREVQQDPGLHMAFVRSALAAVEDGNAAELRVGSTALAAIRETMGGDAFEYAGVQVHAVEEPGLSELGCLVDTARSRIDGRISQRLLAVRRALEEERRKGEVAS